MRRPLTGLTPAALCAVAVALLVATNGAQSAANTATWRWQGAALEGQTTRLISIVDATGVTSLNTAGRGDDVRLVVRTDGRTLQEVAASSVSNSQPLAAFVVADDQANETVVGVARRDVTRVFLTSDVNSRELPLNDAGAFASTGNEAGAKIHLEAIGADGSTIGVLDLPRTSPDCGGALGACQTPGSGKSAEAQARANAGALPRAFLGPRRASDALPRAGRFNVGVPVGSRNGLHREKIIEARRIASYTDGRGRTALLYLLRTKSEICTSTYWQSGAGGGCNPSANFFGGRHLVVGSGHLLSGVADDQVAKVVVVGSRGARHRVALTADGGFIYDCKAYNGCACAIDHVEAYDNAGQKLESESLRCARKPQAAGPRVVSTNPVRVQSGGATPHYTVSNRGRLVPGRGNRIFEGHRYQIFLLGMIGGRAYYRVQLTAHYTCWGSGSADKIGMVGVTGCPTVVGAYPLQFDDNSVELKRGQKTPNVLRLAGIVADQATSVALRDANGKTITTVPVEKNLFAFSPPLPNGFLRAVPLDANGKPLPPHPEWGQHQTLPTNFLGPRATKVLPSQLGTVVQRGEARGVTVSADQNGVVVFDARSINPAARRALGNRIAWFNCFQIDGQNIRHSRSAGISVPFAPEVAFKTVGIKPRYDGCEAGGSYGHRWHDQYGPHSTLEISLTAQGGRYFEDRATARDLAAFVRSAKTQAIRRKTGGALLAAIHSAYGNQVAVLQTLSATAQPGEVGVWTRGTRTVFSERSHFGDRFYVEFDHGKITHENVRGLAFVF